MFVIAENNFFAAWVWLALSAPLLGAFANLFDKYLLSHRKINPWFYLSLDGLVGIVLASVMVFSLKGALDFVPEAIILGCFSGVAFAGFTLFYFYAVRQLHVGVVELILQTSPVFSFVISLTLLQNTYTALTYLGVLLVVFSAVVAIFSEKKQYGAQSFIQFKYVFYIFSLVASMLITISYLLQDLAVEVEDALEVFFWQRLSIAGISLIILSRLHHHVQQLSLSCLALVSLVNAIAAAALFILMMAFASGSFALVTTLSSVQPVWLLFLLWLLRMVKPQHPLLQGESLSIVSFIVACILLLSGVYFISVSH